MTKLLYLQDMTLLKSSAHVLAVDSVTRTVILDQTPFYPQGGGQPSDKGTIIIRDYCAVFEVTSVKKDRVTGNILHFLSSVDGIITGSEVKCEVDPVLRDLNMRSHSGGHLLDHAIEDLHLPLQVRSAYHFHPSPYVEYALTDPSIDLSTEYLKNLQSSLEVAANKLAQEAIPVIIYNGNVSELSDWRRNLLPDPVKQSGSVRLVRFDRAGLDPIPCSGTHVTNSSLIKSIAIKKISLNREKRKLWVVYQLT